MELAMTHSREYMFLRKGTFLLLLGRVPPLFMDIRHFVSIHRNDWDARVNYP